jgi:hypothetical protein
VRVARGHSGVFGPDGSWVGSWITFGEPAMTVIDPDPDRDKRPGVSNNQIQIPIAIHIAGDNTQSTFPGGDAEGTWTNTRGKIEVNLIPKGVRAPALQGHGGKVKTAVPIQIGDGISVTPQQGCSDPF